MCKEIAKCVSTGYRLLFRDEDRDKLTGVGKIRCSDLLGPRVFIATGGQLP